ncbi:MAG: VOC family protein [Sphingomicrobium sp.]
MIIDALEHHKKRAGTTGSLAYALKFRVAVRGSFQHRLLMTPGLELVLNTGGSYMLKQIYVIDLVVDELEAVKPDFDRLFGTEPLIIEPGMAPGMEINAMYYQMPGDGAGIHAIGIFDRSGDGPKDVPTGAFLVGILCDDVDASVDEIRARGINFAYPTQQSYAVGRNNITESLNGVSFSIAQHNEDGYRSGQAMMKTKAGSPDFGDPSQGGMLKQLYVFDIIVHDLDDAIKNYKALFGVDPIDTSSITGSDGEVRSVHFPAPGDGAGIHSVGLFQLTTDNPKSESGKKLKKALDTRGEGIFLIGFLVDDIDKAQDTLEARGFDFITKEKTEYRMGRGNTISNIHGTDYWFAQHHEQAYGDYRKMEAEPV